MDKFWSCLLFYSTLSFLDLYFNFDNFINPGYFENIRKKSDHICHLTLVFWNFWNFWNLWLGYPMNTFY